MGKNLFSDEVLLPAAHFLNPVLYKGDSRKALLLLSLGLNWTGELAYECVALANNRSRGHVDSGE